MKFEDVLEEIGGFGVYQKWVFFLTLPMNLLAGFYILNPVFLLATPLHRCAIPGYDNDTYGIQSGYHEELVNKTIPPSGMDSEKYDRCHLYASLDELGTNTTNIQLGPNASDEMVSCDRWVYDTSVFGETFVTEIDLVCSKKIWVANAEMMLYFGMLIGALASGVLADKFGRKIVLCISLLFMAISSVSLTWADNYPLFVILQFILGGSTITMLMTGYIISLEITGARYRIWPGVIAVFPYIIGLVLYSAIAYACKDWYRIELVTSIPAILLISYWWLMPESPRWLLSKGRVQEAESIIRKAASWNRAKLPDEIFDKEAVIDTLEKEKSANVLHLFTSKKMCIRTLLILFNWLVVAFAYFGLGLNIDNLNGNVYINSGLSAIVEIPANIIVIIFLDRIGRRRLYLLSMVVGGVSCVCTLLSNEYAKGTVWLTVTLAMIGKLGVTAGYSVQYVHSAELFPTVLRNAGMGCASLSARIGSMVAPYIVNLGDSIGGAFGETFPLIIFGVMSFLSAIFSMWLPETLNTNLPETLEDGKRLGSGDLEMKSSVHVLENGLLDEALQTDNRCEQSYTI